MVCTKAERTLSFECSVVLLLSDMTCADRAPPSSRWWTSRSLVISIGEVNAVHPQHLITSPNYPDKSPLNVCARVRLSWFYRQIKLHRAHTFILGTDAHIHWMHRHKTVKQRINSQPVSLTSWKAAEKVFEIQRVIRGRKKHSAGKVFVSLTLLRFILSGDILQDWLG